MRVTLNVFLTVCDTKGFTPKMRALYVFSLLALLIQHLQRWKQCRSGGGALRRLVPPEDFGIVSGMLNVKWDRIAPASNVSHTVVLRPLKAGYFNFTSASVSYLAQEGGEVMVGYTSAPGQGGILAQREFDRRFSPHYLDWAAFGVMTLPSIGIPLLLWFSSKRKYDSPKAKKN
ncbi:hypothetical protein DPEC_G00203100 [Dallia pectoralis]|uniref:Uncharacterized protein n=1 Tax=Dallia pectoralis TaxID=75939 RepID=A0ACC2G9P4_DALPE|nr:hypothetical protein DPEC_G00203100 [Dallia pectoralis]